MLKHLARAAAVVVAAVSMSVGWPSTASAEDRVTKALLNVLRQNGQITEKQHEKLVGLLAQEQEEDSTAARPGALNVYWKDGLRFDSSDGAFRLKIGGRIQHDWAYMDGTGNLDSLVGDPASGTEFRRVRLYISGTLYERFNFKAQYDFAGGEASVKDMYVGMTGLPYVGNLRLGHFKEPFSLEQLTSSKYVTFQERSLANVFAPGRNSGVMLFDDALESRLTWAIGAFRETDDFGDGFGEDSPYNITARVTGTPWLRDESHFVHLGLSYSHKFRNDDPIGFSQRPEAHLAPRLVDTGPVLTDGVDLVNPELAVLFGPWSLQAEYVRAFVDAAGDNQDFGGFYVQGSYFLTGEHRHYNPAVGAFGRVRPTRNFDLKGGLGAWELAVRYSHLDLDNGGVEGGELGDFTIGLNWYLNPNFRAIFNYVRADLKGEGEANIVETRLQVEF